MRVDVEMGAPAAAYYQTLYQSVETFCSAQRLVPAAAEFETIALGLLADHLGRALTNEERLSMSAASLLACKTDIEHDKGLMERVSAEIKTRSGRRTLLAWLEHERETIVVEWRTGAHKITEVARLREEFNVHATSFNETGNIADARRALTAAASLKPLFVEMDVDNDDGWLESWAAHADAIREQVDAWDEHEREIKRQERIASHRAERAHDETIPDTLCAHCRKRPRHFDDACKRCANDLGIRPTGKV